MRNNSLNFFDLARLQQQIDTDSERPLRELRQRDHVLGKKIAHTDSIQQLKAWLDLVDNKNSENKKTDSTDTSNTKNPHHIEGFLIFCLIAFASLLGMVAMSGVLFANPQQPVNLLLFLGLFIGLQLFFILATLGAAILPLKESSLYSTFAFINPAAWAFKQSLRRYSATLPWQRVPRLSRLLLLKWGQIFAISFNVALLLTFYLCLMVSDRNFGWSSTFNISNTGLHTFLHYLSLPWQWLGGDVNPDLVATTRYEGLQTQFGSEQTAAMRQWWPYLFFALACYGLLPRLILFVGFYVSFHNELQKALLHYPGVSLVLGRLNGPLVDTQAANEEQTVIEANDLPTPKTHPLSGEQWLLDWCQAMAATKIDLQTLGININTTISGGLDVGADEENILHLNQEQPKTLLIAVKSWEPPLADLSDFISALHQDIGCILLLLPLPEKHVGDSEWKDWQQFARSKLTKPVQIMRADESKAQ